MSLCYLRSKYWSVGCVQEQGFTFEPVVNVNTLFIKPLQLSHFDSRFFSYFPGMLLLSDFRRWIHCNTALLVQLSLHSVSQQCFMCTFINVWHWIYLTQCQLSHRTGRDGLVSLDVHCFSFLSDPLPQALSLLGLGDRSGEMFQLIITTFLHSI